MVNSFHGYKALYDLFSAEASLIPSHPTLPSCFAHLHLILQTSRALPQFRIFAHTILLCWKLFPPPSSRLAWPRPFCRSLNTVLSPTDLVVSLPIIPSLLILVSHGALMSVRNYNFSLVCLLYCFSPYLSRNPMGEEPRSCCSLFHPQSQGECLAHSRYSKKYQLSLWVNYRKRQTYRHNLVAGTNDNLT